MSAAYLALSINDGPPGLFVQLLVVLLANVIGVVRLFVLAQSASNHSANKGIKVETWSIPGARTSSGTWTATPCKTAVTSDIASLTVA